MLYKQGMAALSLAILIMVLPVVRYPGFTGTRGQSIMSEESDSMTSTRDLKSMGLTLNQHDISTSYPDEISPAHVGTTTWGGSGDDMGGAIAVDGSGNLYVTGYFNGVVDFNPGGGVDSHSSNGGRDVFLSKFDASGNFQWARTWGGSGDERGEGLVVDGSGNVYVAGPFQNTVDFNPTGGASHTSNAGSMNNIFLSKFSPDGTFQWVRTWGPSDGGAEGYGIAIDGSNNVYVVGDFSGTTCDFNPWGAPDIHTNHPPASGSSYGRLFDAFLSKFDSNGNFIWAKTWGGEGYDDGPGVVVDGLGNVYVGGMYASQTINFDPAGESGGLGHPAHDSGILVDAFLSKFDSNGTFLWVKTWGGQGTDEVGQALALDGLNNVYLGGRFGCVNCDFDPGTGTSLRSSNGDLDAFVSKFDSDGTFQWEKTWGGTGWDAVGGLTTGSSSNLYVTGLFKNTVDFGSGSGVSSNGLWDAFLCKFDLNGNFQGTQTWGGPGDDSSNRLAKDAAGNVYVTGWFQGAVDFNPKGGGDIHTSNGGKDVFFLIFSAKRTIADFNGDGKTDVSIFRPSNGVWYVNGQFSQQWGGAGDIPVGGDYNGDGITDVAVFRPSSGMWYVKDQFVSQYGGAGDIPVPGDYNGDGTTDVAVFRPSNGVWYVNGQFAVQYGGNGDIPVPDDYNGDGRTDISVFRPSNGTWYIYGTSTVQYGGNGDIPVPGDYNGDGTTDVAVFRPSNGTWYIYGISTVQYGGNGDIPVPADYNGDGATDVAVFRPSSGTWYIYGISTVQYGGNGDFPAPARDTNGDGDPYQDLNQ